VPHRRAYQERLTRLEILLTELYQQDLNADLKRRIFIELERLRVERLVLERHFPESKQPYQP
jgi:hypothetical protein